MPTRRGWACLALAASAIAVLFIILFAVAQSRSGRTETSLNVTVQQVTPEEVWYDGAQWSTHPEPIVDRSDTDVPMELTVEELIVGAGAAGLNIAAQLSQAKKETGTSKSRMSILQVEGSKVIGGKVRSVRGLEPPGYDKSFGKIRLALTTRRVLTLRGMLTRNMHTQYNIPVFHSPYYNRLMLRGRNITCPNPTAKALATLEEYFGANPYTNTRDDRAALAFAYSAGCGDHPDLVDAVSGAFRNTRPLADPSANPDPETAFYEYLLHGGILEYARYETHMQADAADFDMYTTDGKHPLTGAQCTMGVDCPIDLAKKYRTDVASFVRKLLSYSNTTDFDKRVGNPEYATLIKLLNTGFFGDHEKGFDIVSYIGYLLGEWVNTNSVAGYPIGGPIRLMKKLRKHSKQNGVKLLLNERVTTVNHAPSGSHGFKYVATTNKGRVIKVKNWIFFTGSSYYLFAKPPEDSMERWAGAHLSGDVIDALRAVPEMRAPRPQRVFKSVAQWAPGENAFFDYLLDKKDGNHTFRILSDGGCFSRAEFVDTPFDQCTKAVTDAYSDSLCAPIWRLMLQRAIDGHPEQLIRARVDSMQLMLGQTNIPPPKLMAAADIPDGWHWLTAFFGNFTNMQITLKAARPVPGLFVSWSGEAYHPDLNGWQDGAFSSGWFALFEAFPSSTPVGAKLRVLRHRLDMTAPEPGTGAVNSGSVFSRAGYQPPLFRNPDSSYMSPNEYWWPYKYQNNTHTMHSSTRDWCKASKYVNVPTTSYTEDEDDDEPAYPISS